jgi:hypothetical protein
MSWLKTLTDEMLKRLPQRQFSPVLIFGFDDVSAAIEIVEKAIAESSAATEALSTAQAKKAAADPSHSYIENPVFAPMAAEFWKAEMTFPIILRRSLFIAICSHVEHVLRQWCDFLDAEWTLKQPFGSFKKRGNESDLHHCVRYLHDVAALPLADFESWQEWNALDAYRIARNCLAHNGGLVDRATDGPKIESLPQFQVDTSGLLMIAPVVHLLPGACEAAAQNARAFFERLTAIGTAARSTRHDQ